MQDTPDLEKLLRQSEANPYALDDFLDSWNRYFQPATGTADFATDLPTAAVDSLGVDPNTEVVAPQIKRMINAFPSPALAIGSDAKIVGMNIASMERYTVNPGETIDALPISLVDGTTIAEQVSQAIHKKRNSRTARFFQAIHDTTDHRVTLALLVNHSSSNAGALMFVIDPKGHPQLGELLEEAFGLTAAECEILLEFLQGQMAQDIAVSRGRSYRTVRTQLNTVMQKVGASSQADLMRQILALAQFQFDLSLVSDVANHPHRKTVHLVRPAGRSVEVTLSGDMSGPLVVLLVDISLYRFPAFLEARFAAEGFCVASLCRPGFGGTNPKKNVGYGETLTEDFTALLDNMACDRCVLVGHNSSAPWAYFLGGKVRERIEKIVVLTPLLPLDFFDISEVKIPWATGIGYATLHAPKLLKLILAAGLRGWKALGTRKFVSTQLRGCELDSKAACQADNVEEWDASLEAASVQGIDAFASDIRVSFGDWTSYVEECHASVELMHGTLDPMCPISAVRQFAAQFPSQHTLFEIEGAGYMTHYTHSSAFIERIKPKNCRLSVP